MKRRKILFLATGGTIASLATDRGFVPGLSGQDLIQAVKDLGLICDAQVKQLMNIDSSDMQVADWRTIARAVALAAPKYDGVVIAHGTDTMCYTAAALSFMLSDLDIPVILTGAQKPILELDSDGPRNLLAAAKLATSDLKGVFVAFNNKIINGSRAFKMYSSNEDAYVSRNFPYVGKVNSDYSLDIKLRPRRLRGFRPLMTAFCEDVFLLKISPATNASILDYVATAGYRGLVIEGFGTGGIANLNRGVLDAIDYLVRDLSIPVVMISQCPYDGVNLAVYGIGDQARQAGVIPGNDMTTETALVKLMWILGQTRELDRVRQMILTNYCDEITV